MPSKRKRRSAPADAAVGADIARLARSGQPSVRALLAPAVIVLLTLLAYARVYTAGFIWDDPEHVVNNHTLRDLGGLWEIWSSFRSIPQWYPLTHTSFWIEYQWWGARPAGYHAVNVLLHAANAVLLWHILTRLRVRGAYLASLVFALHPVMVESVAWVTERKNVLSMLFYLLSARVYLFRILDERFEPRSWDETSPVDPLRAEERGPSATPRKVPGESARRAFGVALLLFVCALLSKTVTASLPAAILLIVWWKRGTVRLKDALPLLPFFALGLLLALNTARLEVEHVGADPASIAELRLSIVQRVFIAGRAIWFYAGKLIAPGGLSFIYPRWSGVERAEPWLWVFPALVLTVLAALFALRQQIGRGPLVAVLLFCGTLVPALGFANVYPMRFSFVADHFQYHASIALIALVCAALAALFASSPKHAPAARFAALLLVGGLGTATFTRVDVYRSAESLWRDTLAKNPNSWMVNTNLANVLVADGRPDEAADHYLRALELAPNLYDTHTNAGSVYGMRGQYDRAIAEFQEALRLNPRFAPAYYNWGHVFEKQKLIDQAVEKYQEALRLAPHYPEANYRLAGILASRGKDDEAIDRYRTAIAYNQDYAEAREDLALLLLKRKEFPEAVDNLLNAVRVRPKRAELWTNLGSALLQSGHPEDAVVAFQNALTLRPDLPQASAGLRTARTLLQQTR